MTLSDIEKLYADYFNDVMELRRSLKPGEGMLGIGRRVGDDPCQMRFAGKLKAALEELAASAPPSAEVKEILEYIYRKPLEYSEDDSCYWMLIAVHRYTPSCIGLLSPAEAKELLDWYNRCYPRFRRLPAQADAAKALKKRAK